MDIKPSDIDRIFFNNDDDIIEETDTYVRHQAYITSPLVSANLSRAYTHLKSGVPVMLISADLTGLPKSELEKRRTNLVDDIKANDLGFIKLAGAWQNPYEDEPTFEVSYMVVGKLIYNGEVMPYNEMRDLAYRWWKKYNQSSVIVGKYNSDTTKYDFEMLCYSYDEKWNVTGEKVQDFHNIKFGTAEDIEKFHKEVVEWKRTNEPDFEDDGFGYTKIKTKNKSGFNLLDKDSEEYNQIKNHKMFASVFVPAPYRSRKNMY